MSKKRIDPHARLVECLRGKFAADGWAFFTQVANRVGGPSNYADAVALSLYRSRGMHLHGFEAKVTREDLKHELERPRKADAVGRRCHYWWLVIEDESVLNGLDVPQAWGVLVRRGQGTRELHRPTILDPEPLDLPFLAALLVRAKEFLEATDLATVRNAAYERGYKDGSRRAEESMNSRVKELEVVRKRIQIFEERSGVQIDRYDADKIGDAVSAVLYDNPLERVVWLHELLQETTNRMGKAVEQLRQAQLAKVP